MLPGVAEAIVYVLLVSYCVLVWDLFVAFFKIICFPSFGDCSTKKQPGNPLKRRNSTHMMTSPRFKPRTHL